MTRKLTLCLIAGCIAFALLYFWEATKFSPPVSEECHQVHLHISTTGDTTTNNANNNNNNNANSNNNNNNDLQTSSSSTNLPIQCWHTNHYPLESPYTRYLVGCILFKNEGRYLKEWLLFHQLAGFDHLYMYDDGSTDDFMPILQPFIDKGFVSYIKWGGVFEPGKVQTGQIRHCMANYANYSEWLSFFDLDEFFVPMWEMPKGQTTGFLSSMLHEFYLPYAGVELHRAAYDSSGHVDPPDGLVIEHFISRYTPVNTAGKLVLHSKYVKRFSGHTALAKDGYTIVDARGGDVNADRQFIDNPLRMNHYVTRSFNECMAKGNQTAFPGAWRAGDTLGYCNKGMVGTPQYEPFIHFKDDYLARHYAPLVKQCMKTI
eukprot:TRINITY_DN4807_c0_g1_i1.p1 TRINITY_DN4807_c0_g1~~TRINITY_DN4807_c0_g1_i1.p1  ORF type:complete len:374 (-),score=50.79 TRINITY_DN4807_c0_g1_i1:31-1152(-)